MRLSPTQHRYIVNSLVERGIAESAIHVEFFDHLVSSVEVVMADGKTFEKALREVLSNYKNEELQRLLEVTLNRQQQSLRIREMKFRFGIYLGLALCFWIFVEYLTGALFGIPELGVIYGLLSEILIAGFLLVAVKHFIQKTYLIKHDFLALLKFNMSLLLTSALVVFGFMFFYVGWINTDLYGLYENEPAGQKELFAKLVVPLMGVGVLIEGLFIALIVSFVKRQSVA